VTLRGLIRRLDPARGGEPVGSIALDEAGRDRANSPLPSATADEMMIFMRS